METRENGQEKKNKIKIVLFKKVLTLSANNNFQKRRSNKWMPINFWRLLLYKDLNDNFTNEILRSIMNTIKKFEKTRKVFFPVYFWVGVFFYSRRVCFFLFLTCMKKFNINSCWPNRYISLNNISIYYSSLALNATIWSEFYSIQSGLYCRSEGFTIQWDQHP